MDQPMDAEEVELVEDRHEQQSAEREPLEADSPLWAMENVILTPHMSGARRDYNTDACKLFADNLRRFRAVQPLYNVIDRTLGY